MAHYVDLSSVNQTIIAGDDNDVIRTGAGYDTIYAGKGSDYVHAGMGDDTFVHNFEHSSASTDVNKYVGGVGTDKLVINISAENAQREDFQQDLIAFKAHQQNWWSKTFKPFTFKSMNLTVKSLEEIELNILTAQDDQASVAENGMVEVDVLSNDSLTSDKGMTLVSAQIVDGEGLVTLKNNKLVFDTNQEFASLKDGEQTTVTIEYVVKDDINGTTTTATLEVLVTGTDAQSIQQVIEAEGTDISLQNQAVDLDATNNQTDLTLDHLLYGSEAIGFIANGASNVQLTQINDAETLAVYQPYTALENLAVELTAII